MAEKIILHALENNEGFMVLTGEAGLGKTLLLRLLLAELRGVKVPAVVLSPAVTPVGLLHLLLGELEVPCSGEESEAILFQRFQDTAIRHAQEGREIFIVVDEAQNMPVATLEQLRMLSNMETGSRKLMQILLIGQEQLEETLRDQRLAQLMQRVVVHERLRPLSRRETEQYVGFRLGRAGRGDIGLSRGAVRLLHGASGGVPRLINKIMDRVLLLASAETPARIRRRHVRDAVATLARQDITLRQGRRAPAAVLLGAVTLFWLLASFMLPGVAMGARRLPPVDGMVAFPGPLADYGASSALWGGFLPPGHGCGEEE